jgi:hypothetical protein
MSEFIFTQKKPQQYHGPISSSDINERYEQNYADLIYLYNKYNVIDKKVAEVIERVVKDNIFLTAAVNDLFDRIRSIESQYTNQITLYSKSQVDVSPFIGTQYAVSTSEALNFDDYYNQLTLPIVSGSSHSKIKFINPIKGQIIPDFLETRVDPNGVAGGDGNGAVVETTPVQNAFLNMPDKVWRRNVILNSYDPLGVSMYLYVKVPVGTMGSTLSNCIRLSPYPFNGVDVVKIEYTTKSNPTLSDADSYVSLNPFSFYEGNYDALGKVPPGGWSTIGSDTVVNSGPLSFYYPETPVTAFRIQLRQKNYIIENNKYVYTYGLSDFDIRYEKFLPAGRTFIKFSAPTGKTINEIVNVSPKIYNVSPTVLSDVFSYRIFYKNGESYTLNNSGTSTDVYIEVSITMLDDKIPPVLSDLIVEADYNL